MTLSRWRIGQAAYFLAASALSVLLLVVAGGCGTSPGTAPANSPRTGTAGPKHPCGRTGKPPARYRHVVWIVMENHSASQALASPFVKHLAEQCGVATNYHAITHPSLPNYLAMTSGSTHGVADDDSPKEHPLSGPSIFSQLGTRGWRSLEEGMPSPCSIADGGRYRVKHNPAPYYTNVRAACRTRDVPLRSSPDISAPFTLVTPDLCHDTHDCPVATGDGWLSVFVSRLVRDRHYRARETAIFITWDEDDWAGSNRVATLVIAPSTRPGTKSALPFNHYSLLRTTEAMLGIHHYLGGASRALDMRPAFKL